MEKVEERFRPEDLDGYAAMCADPEVMRHLSPGRDPGSAARPLPARADGLGPVARVEAARQNASDCGSQKAPTRPMRAKIRRISAGCGRRESGCSLVEYHSRAICQSWLIR